MATAVAATMAGVGAAILLRNAYKGYVKEVTKGAVKSGATAAKRIVKAPTGPMSTYAMSELFATWPGSFNATMTTKEACLILGLEQDEISQANVEAAHKHLMIKNHPDLGGSQYIAAKLNEAKTLLIEEANQ
eukprot:TRINITY_DN68147_c2_g2_i1.p1 TRINITY_DN68147_c2_g2~~TRINITY_DN68147_c2_g2_i1.p1  ORF type:complete len:132 (+),score=9.45 TRINITY_DN68147_c2_g2_i1:27-422(+)